MTSTSQGRYFASLTVETINWLLEVDLTGLSKPWKGSIPFPVYILGEDDDVSSSLFERSPQLIDICDYLNGQQYPTTRLYFSPKAYPPPTSNADMAGKNAKEYQGWKDLKRDLCISAHSAGNPIISNGKKGVLMSRSFTCVNFRRIKSKAQEVSMENPLRGASMTSNDKGNRRLDGKKGPRKIQNNDQHYS